MLVAPLYASDLDDLQKLSRISPKCVCSPCDAATHLGCAGAQRGLNTAISLRLGRRILGVGVR